MQFATEIAQASYVAVESVIFKRLNDYGVVQPGCILYFCTRMEPQERQMSHCSFC